MKRVLAAIILLIVISSSSRGACVSGDGERIAQSIQPIPSTQDTVAYDSVAAAGWLDNWDVRGRARIGVARLQLREADGPLTIFYLSMNYRASLTTRGSGPDALRFGLAAEAGIFYLFPYLMIGPEIRYRDLYLEGHIGTTFVFLVGTDTPGGSGASVGGLSLGWIVGSPEIVHVELQAGVDVVSLFADDRPTAVMPHATVAFRF